MASDVESAVAVETENVIFPEYRGWLLEEDFALKQLCSGITVHDTNNAAREVKVWFQLPELEQRTVTFPHIMIAFLGQSIAHEREHRGYVPFGTEAYTDNDADWMGEFPIPLDLSYQITTGARFAQQDRQLVWQLMQPGRLMTRFGSLTCPSGTVRRLDIDQEAVNGDGVDGDGKRYFRKIWRIRVSAEIAYQTLAVSRVAETILTLKRSDTNTVDRTVTTT